MTLQQTAGASYLRLMLFWAVAAGLMAGSGPVVAAFRGRWAESASLGALVSSGIVLLIFLYSKLGWTRMSECGVGFDRGTAARVGLGFVLGLLLLAAPVAVLAVVDGVRWARAPQVDLSVAAAAVGAYLLLSCMEEVVFRSYPLLGLQNALGVWTAQAIVAVVFILYHVVGGQPWVSAVVGTGLGSLLFGTAAMATRGLALPIGLHAAWNFGSWALGDKGSPGLWTPVFTHPPSVAGTFAYIAAFLLWTVAFVVWTTRSSKVSPQLARSRDLV